MTTTPAIETTETDHVHLLYVWLCLLENLVIKTKRVIPSIPKLQEEMQHAAALAAANLTLGEQVDQSRSRFGSTRCLSCFFDMCVPPALPSEAAKLAHCG